MKPGMAIMGFLGLTINDEFAHDNINFSLPLMVRMTFGRSLMKYGQKGILYPLPAQNQPMWLVLYNKLLHLQ